MDTFEVLEIPLLPDFDFLGPDTAILPLDVKIDEDDNQRGLKYRNDLADPKEALSETYEERSTPHNAVLFVNKEQFGTSMNYIPEALNLRCCFLTPGFLPADLNLAFKSDRSMDVEKRPSRARVHTSNFMIPADSVTNFTFKEIEMAEFPENIHKNSKSRNQKFLRFYKLSFDAYGLFMSSGAHIPKLTGSTSAFASKIDFLKALSVASAKNNPDHFDIYLTCYSRILEIEVKDFEKCVKSEKEHPPLDIFFKETPSLGKLNRGNITKFTERPNLKVQVAKLAWANERKYKFSHTYGAIYEQNFVDAVQAKLATEKFDATFLQSPGCPPAVDGKCARYIVAVNWYNTEIAIPQPGNPYSIELNSLGYLSSNPPDKVPGKVITETAPNDNDMDFDDILIDAEDQKPKKRKQKKEKYADEESTEDIVVTPVWSGMCINAPSGYYRENMVWFSVDRPFLPLAIGSDRSSARELSALEVPSMHVKFTNVTSFNNAFNMATKVKISLFPEKNHQTLNDELRALNTLFETAETDPKKKKLLNFIIGQPQVNDTEFVNLLADCGPTVFSSRLSPSQQAARDSLTKIPNNTAITVGPYGAGKSTLARIVMAELSSKGPEDADKKYQILYTCPSNKQVDDAALKFEEMNKKEGLGLVVTRVHNIKGEKRSVVRLFGNDRHSSSKRFYDEECNALAAEFIMASIFGQMSKDINTKRSRGDHRRVHEQLSLSRRMYDRMDADKDTYEYQWLKNHLCRHSGFDAIDGYLSMDDRELFMENITILQNDTIRNSDVIFSTLNNACKANLYENFRAKLLILDEACRATELSYLILPAFYDGILWSLGDPNQMGPVVLSAGREEDPVPFVNPLQNQRLLPYMSRYIRNGHPMTLLKEQFRCRSDVAYFVSKEFYHGQVKLAPGIKDEYTSILRKVSKKWGFAGNTSLCFINAEGSRSHVERGGTSTVNDDHLCLVRDMISDLLEEKNFEGGITVIAMYKAQVLKYREMIAKIGWAGRVDARTVDDAQGFENDVIILDLVRSRGVGFIGAPTRINVALSRAKYLQLVVGNFNMLRVQDNFGDFYIPKAAQYKAKTRHIFSLKKFVEDISKGKNALVDQDFHYSWAPYA